MFYTYLLKCVPTGEYYYGVKYSADANPSQFWVTYFTSSKYVKDRIELFGKDSFIFEIRKIFSCAKAARAWEDKVLRRLKVVERYDFLNKSYGLQHDNRRTRKGYTQMYFLSDDQYKFVEPILVHYLISSNIAIPKGKPKSAATREKISKSLSGKKKSKEHVEKMKLATKGKKTGREIDRYGEEVAMQKSKRRSKKLVDFYKTNTHFAKNKTYVEILGDEKAESLKRQRSDFLKENNPSLNTKGKTYEEIHGAEKANKLKAEKSLIGKKNKKIYLIYSEEQLLFTGDRTEAGNFISSTFALPPSNILYKTEVLSNLGITLETQRGHH